MPNEEVMGREGKRRGYHYLGPPPFGEMGGQIKSIPNARGKSFRRGRIDGRDTSRGLPTGVGWSEDAIKNPG